ncbi:MAG TPA: hypothetical protein VLH35_08120 [Candidatus Acidoferrales bacterium]|nr:hypothetical protein [Candidatus Acidoferrales bacterium]
MHSARTFTILCSIVVLIVSGVIIAGIGGSSALQTPSAPEFTVSFVDASYDVPPKYAVSGFTGQNEMVEAGYYVQYKYVEVKIKNQPFVSYHNENDSVVGLSYHVTVKGHFDDWSKWAGSCGVSSSGKEYTIVTFTLKDNNGSESHATELSTDTLGGLANGGQLDVRVQAVIGYYTTIYGTPSPYDGMFGGDGKPAHHDVFTGEYSSWSTQTLTISAASTSSSSSSATSPAPTDSTSTSQSTTNPTQQGTATGATFGFNLEQVAIIVLVCFVAGLVVVVAVQQRRLGKIGAQLQNRA